jgi:hypothetical protein
MIHFLNQLQLISILSYKSNALICKEGMKKDGSSDNLVGNELRDFLEQVFLFKIP